MGFQMQVTSNQTSKNVLIFELHWAHNQAIFDQVIIKKNTIFMKTKQTICIIIF